ncbi:MAG: hypothetical protein GY870_05335 [archaeon]|nr:hypothetical protein [archaeon]
MRYKTWNKIDCQMHTISRSFEELQMLKHCGVTDIISTMFIPIKTKEAGTFNDLFYWLLNEEPKRGALAGLNIHPALGIHPRMVPTDQKVLELALRFLEKAIRTKKAVAVGETGLEKGTPEEFISFKRHLEIAGANNLPVIIHTPSGSAKAELTKVIMRELKKNKKVTAAVIDHCDHTNVGIVFSDARTDIKAGISIGPQNLSIKEAMELYKNYSYPNRYVLTSNAGSGPGDYLSIVKAVETFESKNISSKIIQRLSYDNALDIFRGILSEESLI